MANDVMNIIEFSKDVSSQRMQEVYDKILKEENGERKFDFNALLPMPEALNIPGTKTDVMYLFYRVLRKVPRYLQSVQIDRIMAATCFQEIFSSGMKKDIFSMYRSLQKVVHLNVCRQDPRAVEAAAKMNDMYRQALRAAPYKFRGSTQKSTGGIWEYFDDGTDLTNSQILKKEIHDAGYDPCTVEGIQQFAQTEKGKEYLAIGFKIARNIKLYHAKTWYDWCYINWGVKRNSYENVVDLDARRIKFKTEWRMPYEIAELLSKVFPNVPFQWKYASRNCGCHAGIVNHVNGKLQYCGVEQGSDAAYDLYVDCWGESNCVRKRDDGSWEIYTCDCCPHVAANPAQIIC